MGITTSDRRTEETTTRKRGRDDDRQPAPAPPLLRVGVVHYGPPLEGKARCSVVKPYYDVVVFKINPVTDDALARLLPKLRGLDGLVIHVHVTRALRPEVRRSVLAVVRAASTLTHVYWGTPLQYKVAQEGGGERINAVLATFPTIPRVRWLLWYTFEQPYAELVALPTLRPDGRWMAGNDDTSAEVTCTQWFQLFLTKLYPACNTNRLYQRPVGLCQTNAVANCILGDTTLAPYVLAHARPRPGSFLAERLVDILRQQLCQGIRVRTVHGPNVMLDAFQRTYGQECERFINENGIVVFLKQLFPGSALAVVRDRFRPPVIDVPTFMYDDPNLPTQLLGRQLVLVISNNPQWVRVNRDLRAAGNVRYVLTAAICALAFTDHPTEAHVVACYTCGDVQKVFDSNGRVADCAWQEDPENVVRALIGDIHYVLGAEKMYVFQWLALYIATTALPPLRDICRA